MDENEKQAMIELTQAVKKIGAEQEGMAKLLGRMFGLLETIAAHATASGNAHNAHKEEIETLFKAQGQIARFANGLSTQCAEVMKMQADRLAVLEIEVFGDRTPPAFHPASIN
jgi:hypothetical protein